MAEIEPMTDAWWGVFAEDNRVSVADFIDLVAYKNEGIPVPADTLARLEELGYDITDLN